LQADGAVLIVGQEGASARFAHVLHHTAHAHGAVELLLEVDDEFGIFEVLDVGLAAEELLLDEADDFFDLLLGVLSAIEEAEVVEGLFLKGDEDTGKEVLVGDGLGLQAVGHDIVDVLDEDDVGIQVVEVLDEGTVSAGAEEE